MIILLFNMKDFQWKDNETKFFKKDKNKWSIDTINFALNDLGGIQDKIENKVIHIAGTNGKGSTCNFIRSILEHSGYKVGMFTSPHLINYNERIYFNKRFITDKEIEYYSKQIVNKCKNINDISYFEASTLIAILFFTDNNPDYCIFEVGLGGRLDATNVFKKPLVSVITSISYDHMAQLGNTLKQITTEKCGIIKENVPVFSSNTKKEIVDEIMNIASNKKAKLYLQGLNYQIDYDLQPSLLGSHQFENATLAKEVCKYIGVDDFHIKQGISNTVWPGRLQKIILKDFDNKSLNIEDIYIDGAHNEGGMNVLCDFIREKRQKNADYNIIGIFCCLKRKEYKTFFPILAKAQLNNLLFYKSKRDNDDFVEPEELQKLANNYNINNYIIDNFIQTKKYLDRKKKNIIFIFGSLYFVGYVLENYVKE